MNLFDAIRADDTAKIRELVAAGAPIEQRDHEDRTPLMFAAGVGALASAMTLLELKADPLAMDMYGRTASEYAQKRNYAEISDLLPGAKPPKQPSKLVWDAARRGFADTLRELTRGAVELRTQDDEGLTLLYHATVSGNPAAVQALLDAGYETFFQGAAQRSPLRGAMEGNLAQAAKILLDHGANPMDFSKGPNAGVSVRNLDYAKSNSTPEIAALVIQAQKRHDLFTHARDGQYAEVEKLLKEGVAPDSYTDKGETPLHAAAERGHAKIVKLLLDYKADPNKPLRGNKTTPLDLARKHNNVDAERHLLDARALEVEQAARQGMETSAPARAAFRRKTGVPAP